MMTGCFAVMKERADSVLSSNTPTDLFGLDEPSSVIKYTPLSERERKPRISVTGVMPGDLVSIYIDSSCTQKIGEETATTTVVVVSASTLLSDGQYQIYAQRKNGSDFSACSTNFATVKVNTDMNLSSMSQLVKTTAVSLRADIINLSSYDQVSFYNQSNCVGSVLQSTVVYSTNSSIDLHSLSAGIYSFSYRVSYTDRENTIHSSNCINGTSLNLDGLSLTTSYITRWKTDAINVGEKTLKLPMPGQNGLDFNAVVNWGDGTSSKVTLSNTSSQTHNYANAGTY